MHFFCSAYGQTANEYRTKADRYYEKKDYKNASENYGHAVQAYPDDALLNYRAGISYLNIENSEQALIYLDRALQLDPEVDPFIHYHLGIAYQRNYQFTEASAHFSICQQRHKKVASVVKQKIRECEMGDSIMRLPAQAKVRPLGAEINTPFAEHSPLLMPDGKTLIFTSTRSSDPYEVKSGTNYEDVYVSHLRGGEWGPAEKIDPNINVRYNEAAVSLSPDGTTLFLYYEEGNGDIYTSQRVDGRWSKPVPLNRFINHPHYRETTACLSADGKKLYFSSNRPGGRGGLDIYVCRLGENGDWGRPTNLGSVINTRQDEDCPFLQDSTVLYFSSNGHPGLGNNDIFRSELKNGKWGTPENLGYPINSSGYDGFFSLAPKKGTGYYSAHPGTSAANTDIFVATFLPDTPAPSTEPVLASISPGAWDDGSGDENSFAVLKGTVFDRRTSAPLKATLTIVDNATKQVVSTVEADSTGYFRALIPRAGNYGVTTQKQDYLFHSMNLNLAASKRHQEIVTRIGMIKPEVGSKVVMKNIFFDTNESALKPESITELENIRLILVQNPQVRVQINGHTDNVGKEESNMALSLKRAQSVVQYLIDHGIPAHRLEAKGFGSKRPLVSNDDEKGGRQINRRTEIEIIK